MPKMLKLILAAFILPMVIHAAEEAASTLKQVKTDMKRVADWQIAHFYDLFSGNAKPHHPLYWGAGAFYVGLVKYADMADDDHYFEWMRDIGEKYDWKPHRQIYYADDHAVSQMYLELARRSGNKRMYGPTKERLDYIIANPSKQELAFVAPGVKYANIERWTWCDSLFMSPPVWAKLSSITGDKRYLNWMLAEYKASTDRLFDPEENLYFRDNRYFKKREHGRKVFWARGNGWVFGSLALIMDELPNDSDEYAYFKSIYLKMAPKLLSLQAENGCWPVSLLCSDHFPEPETSGTSFFCFGLAWGINNGVLDRETYAPVVLRAWNALASHITKDGMLGYVQPGGIDPVTAKPNESEQYGSGAFLAAGSEVYKMLGGKIKQRDLAKEGWIKK